MKKISLFILAVAMLLTGILVPVSATEPELAAPDLLELVLPSGNNKVTNGPSITTTGAPTITEDPATGIPMASVDASNYYTAMMYFDNNTSNTPNTSFGNFVDSLSLEVYFTIPEDISSTVSVASFMGWNGGLSLQVAKNGWDYALQGVWTAAGNIVGNVPVVPGMTYHAIMTWKQEGDANTIQLYVDGELKATGEGTGGFMTEGAAGDRTFVAGNSMGGKIGICNLYYSALDASQAKAVYKARIGSKMKAPTPDLFQLVLADGSNKVTAGPVVTTNGTPVITQDTVTGMDMATVNSSNYYSAGMYFDNNASNTPNTKLGDLSNSFSMEAYVILPETVEASGNLVTFMDWNGGVGLQVVKNGENLSLQGIWSASGNTVGDVSVEAGKAYHVVLTWFFYAGTNKVALYVNGNLEASVDGTGTFMTEGIEGGRTLAIGNGIGGSVGICNLYYRDLKPAEVVAIYKANVKDLADAKAEQDKAEADKDEEDNKEDDREDNTQTGDIVLFTVGSLLVLAVGICAILKKRMEV
ncbi:MAG: hypothetical protein J6L76_01745 [Clostridia bacterium]|nr:hypothetical protein [Clostridia bacterium]